VAKAAVEAIAAGADMVWISRPESDWTQAYDALLRAARTGAIPLARLNAAVTRIVTAKRELGLRNRSKPLPGTPGAPTTTATPLG
jgi:beta-N-acetylhexosaminidase